MTDGSQQLRADWAERLRAAGLRVTSQRMLVLEIVHSLRHAKPEQIVDRANDLGTSLDLSTVYRAVEVLESVGLLGHAHLDGGSATYHWADSRPHAHLTCRACGRTEAVDGEILAGLADDLSRDFAFTVDVAHTVLYGQCHRCVPRS